MDTINNLTRTRTVASYESRGQYTPAGNGSVLLTWQEPGKRRRTVTLDAANAAFFLASVTGATTKTGKISDRTLDNLIAPYFAPAPVYSYRRGTNGEGYVLARDTGSQIETKILSDRGAARFEIELKGITVPEAHTKKRAEAISRLVEGFWSTTRRSRRTA